MLNFSKTVLRSFLHYNHEHKRIFLVKYSSFGHENCLFREKAIHIYVESIYKLDFSTYFDVQCDAAQNSEKTS